MASLCGMGVRVRDFSSETTRPRDMLFFLKIPYLSRMKICSRHADLFVRLFARAITSEVPPTLSMKISTLYHNFLIDYCRDFSHILHICTRPQVEIYVVYISYILASSRFPCVSIRPGSFLIFFYEFF